MSSIKSWEFVINEKYFIYYDSQNVMIWEILSNAQSEFLFEFETESDITSIQFNPLINNIIIVSFKDETCKIYNILKKSNKEDILFECNKNEKIILSIFNIFNPNLIATLTSSNNIYIWDVRKVLYLNIIKMEKQINMIRWSNYDSDYLEIRYKFNKIRLINTKTKQLEISEEIEGNMNTFNNFLFIKGEENQIFLILIRFDKIEKINCKTNSILNTIQFKDIDIINDNLIKNNNILIIMTPKEIYFIDIISFSIISQFESPGNSKDTFFYIKQDNEIGFKYITNSGKFKEYIFQVNNDRIKLKKNEELINIKENFYEQFNSKILKYACLLNFKDNVEVAKGHEKNYMNIKNIADYFDKIKEVNIFFRKDFITKLLLDDKIVNNKDYKDIKEEKDNEEDEDINSNNELKLEKFIYIRKYIEIFNIKEIKSLKELFEKIMKDNLNDQFIKDFYIEIVKLLVLDNTNEKLLKIYLLFLNFHEKILIKTFKEENIEKYNDELKYYSACFSKEDYKSLFNEDKESEKTKILKFLKEAYALPNFDYGTSNLTNFLKNYEETLANLPNFNQPIEYDCENKELVWFSIKQHIFLFFKELQITKGNSNFLQELRVGLKMVVDKNLFENEDIIGNKLKLQSVVYLIINPCPIDKINSLNFFYNTLISKRNDINELKIKYKNIKDKQLLYNNEIYDDIEDICLENLEDKNYTKEEKYNFIYLVNNYVKNQNKLKQFLMNILKKKVFIDAYEILFGDRNYKLLKKRYLKEFINKRLNFAPIRIKGKVGISDKISLNTLISAKETRIIYKDAIISDNIKEILNTSSYVVTEEHEIFHILDCIPYYENNCSISIDTPRKDKFEGKAEGGYYLELLLFNKIMDSITLLQALFILNEENYDLSLSEFVTRFKSIGKKELEFKEIKGTFNEFNQYLNTKEITTDKLNNTIIELKYSHDPNSILNSYIFRPLENDVAGRFNIKKKKK